MSLIRPSSLLKNATITGSVIATTLAFSVEVNSLENPKTLMDSKKTITATKIWETPPLLIDSESALYDDQRNLIYVSSINGDPSKKDGNGYISKVSLDGKIIEKEWISGLNAPKGLGRVGNNLYVADIDSLVEIDITSGKVTNTLPVEGAKFLNDVATAKDGTVYISDSNSNRILAYKNNTLSVWLESEELAGINGLYPEEDHMKIAIWKGSHYGQVDYSNKQLTKHVTSLFPGNGADGIVPDGMGNYFISDWNGYVVMINSDMDVTPLIDTRKKEIRSADIDYIIDKKILLVPTFPDNKLMAYKISYNQSEK